MGLKGVPDSHRFLGFEGPLTYGEFNRMYEHAVGSTFDEDFSKNKFRDWDSNSGGKVEREEDVEEFLKRAGTPAGWREQRWKGECGQSGEVKRWRGKGGQKNKSWTENFYQRVNENEVLEYVIEYHYDTVTYQGVLGDGEKTDDGKCEYKFEVVNQFFNVNKMIFKVIKHRDAKNKKYTDPTYNYPGGPPTHPGGEPDKQDNPGEWVDWKNQDEIARRYNDPWNEAKQTFRKWRYGYDEDTGKTGIIEPQDWER
jgi:hypothetical protein